MGRSRRGLRAVRPALGQLEEETLQRGPAGGQLADADPRLAELSQALVEAGALIKTLAPQGATLEELFFSLTEDEDARTGMTELEAMEAGR